MTAEITWASDESVESPERLEAEAAARDILTLLGMNVGGTVQTQIAHRIMVAAGTSDRRSYNLGWRHCLNSMRS